MQRARAEFQTVSVWENPFFPDIGVGGEEGNVGTEDAVGDSLEGEDGSLPMRIRVHPRAEITTRRERRVQTGV